MLRKRLIHIHRMHLLTRNELRRLLKFDPTLEKIHKLTVNDLKNHLAIAYKKALILHKNLQSKESQIETIQVLNKYKVITIVDEDYPSVLKTIKDPPIVLYTLGYIDLLNDYPLLSVIGTRNPSNKGREKVKTIVGPIIQNEWTIVSGMALGIDSYAHELALELHGKTIAVLGSGFEHIYPKRNIDLFQSMSKQGLLITEYPPHIKPARYHFPERNRIISGLSFGTLVIEATIKSGTLITVDQALDQGREVYVVPDSPLVRQAEGCNKLIQDGATLALTSEDILRDWDLIGHYIFKKIK